jgi:hypothetical protein
MMNCVINGAVTLPERDDFSKRNCGCSPGARPRLHPQSETDSQRCCLLNAAYLLDQSTQSLGAMQAARTRELDLIQTEKRSWKSRTDCRLADF